MRRAWQLLPWLCLLLAGAAWPKDELEAALPVIRLEAGPHLSACEGPLQPGTAPVFLTDARCITAWVQLSHVSARHTVRFRYYDPDGTLYLATREDWSVAPAPGKTGYHRTAWVRHRLPIAGEQAALSPGAWRVSVALDNVAAADATFRLEPPPIAPPPALAEGRARYLSLEYESALSRLTEFATAEVRGAALPEAYWWLALCHLALGRPDEAQRSLVEILRLQPTWSISPELAKQAGGEGLLDQLELLRNKSFPELYKKTGFPPEAELSKAEQPPLLQRRWPLWKKLLVYGGLPVGVGVAVLIAARGDSPEEPLGLTFTVSQDAPRGTDYGYLCEGAIEAEIQVFGGHGPFEAILTLNQIGGFPQLVRINGADLTPGIETVIQKLGRLDGGRTELRLPAVDTNGRFECFLRFGLLIKERASTADFASVQVGQALPEALRQRLATDVSMAGAFHFDVIHQRGKGCTCLEGQCPP